MLHGFSLTISRSAYGGLAVELAGDLVAEGSSSTATARVS
jgi:hypothetical protein